MALEVKSKDCRSSGLVCFILAMYWSGGEGILPLLVSQ